MSKCKVFDEHVEVRIIRKGKEKSVPFCDLKEGDQVVSHGFDFVVDDCHQCEDSHYDGWVLYDTDGNSYFPEDFDAKLIRTE